MTHTAGCGQQVGSPVWHRSRSAGSSSNSSPPTGLAPATTRPQVRSVGRSWG